MILSRRSLFIGTASLVVAPAIVRPTQYGPSPQDMQWAREQVAKWR